MRALRTAALAGALAAALGTVAGPARAAEEVPDHEWSFEGIFGHYDKAALQRGLQVYREVCSACHALDLVAFRNLTDLGYNEEEVKALAAEYSIMDGPDESGETFERPGRASDYFPPPFPNEKAAAAANNGAVPPDLSLLAKAREPGPEYIRALLIGYEEPPPNFELLEGLHYNEYFPGKQIAMPPPLSDGAVQYGDGTEASVQQMASDVAGFMMWAAEPKLEERKQTGVKVMLFLLVFTGLLYATKRKVWADVH